MHAGSITPLDVPTLTRHVVFFGGTFDPPHDAHVKLVAAARDVIDREATLVFVPAAKSPFKVGVAGTAAAHRIAMVRLAIVGVRDAVVWTDEVDRAAAAPDVPSYTVDSIARMRTVLPRAKVTLLIGADQAASFHRWREWRTLLERTSVRALLREPFVTAEQLMDALRESGAWSDAEIEAWRGRVVAMHGPIHPARSTDIRQRIAASGIASVPREWLHPDVARYIVEHDLYSE
ncbi:MAG TPA: nicotinate-nicotinamide nucleotide adenylyltransferase [Phycisphaerales bacterium]|nr:nicotinate-nicotinamide nucleotide adenylyltransferase [Phycisphaerales bacterium]